MTGEPVSPERMAELLAEYDAAVEASRAAQQRHYVASDALVSAQCGVHYATEPSPRSGHDLRHLCTLPRGHDGEHGKLREQPPA